MCLKIICSISLHVTDVNETGLWLAERLLSPFLISAVITAIIQPSGTEPISCDFFIYCCYIWCNDGSTIF